MPQTYPADTVNIPLAEDLTPADILADLSGVSANRLYGFERFILQSVRSGHVKATFEREGHGRGGQYNLDVTGHPKPWAD